MSGRKPPRNQSDPSPSIKNGGKEKREISGAIRIAGEIETEFPPDIKDEYITSSRDSTARERKRYKVERVTLGFVILVALLNLIQAVESVRSANASHASINQAENNRRDDDRAWIVISQIEVIGSRQPDGTFSTNWKYGIRAKNVGKTIARDIVIHVGQSFGILNSTGVAMTQNFVNKAPPESGPQSLAPEQETFIPISARSGQAPTERNPVSNVVGSIDYVDGFGASHWITFCFYPSDEQGHLQYCVSGNDQDRNPEPSR